MVVMTAGASAVNAERRVALVIGNQAYEHASHLANPENDATAIAAKLESIGFDVSLHIDLGGQDFRVALGAFTEKALASDLAMVFYAGHGIEIGGQNYLIPVDAKMKSEATAQFETISLDGVLSTIRSTGKLGMVMLDACRDNPFAKTMERKNGTRAVSRGLANVSVEQESGVLVSFAAQAGSTADDGDGDHSPYTTALLDVLDKPGLEVGRMFRRVRANVKAQTNGKQVPIERMQLPDEEIYLVPPLNTGSSAENSNSAPETTRQTEDPLLAYLAAIESGQRKPLERFVQQYPDHFKAADARKLLVRIAEDEYWERAKITDTAKAYENYLLAFSDGRHRSDAEGRLDALLTEEQAVEIERIEPSFNCKYAKTPVELAICSNNDLAVQDHDLVAVYEAAEDAGRVDRTIQSNWVTDREAACASAGGGVARCVQKFTVDRILALSTIGADTMTGINLSCPALDGDFGIAGVKSNSTLAVRSGPGKQYDLVAELPYNASHVSVSSCTGDNWCQVTYGCISGYASGANLERGRWHDGVAFTGSYSVTDHPMDQKLNVRSGAGTNYTVIAELPPNALGVDVTDCQTEQGYKFRWCSLSWQGISGWAYGRYLVDEARDKPTAATTVEAKMCMKLWFQRNSIFHDNGYCFGSAKGKKYFDNASCVTSKPALNATEKSRVKSLQQTEAALGC